MGLHLSVVGDLLQGVGRISCAHYARMVGRFVVGRFVVGRFVVGRILSQSANKLMRVRCSSGAATH